jgi:hypothetical protein
MNRQARREAKHRKPQLGKTLTLPKIIMRQYAFEGIDAALNTLKSNHIDHIDGQPVVWDREETSFLVLSELLSGWIEYWKTIAKKTGRTHNWVALDQLLAIIDTPRDLTLDLIADCELSVNKMKDWYMQVDYDLLRNTSIDLGIQFRLEALQ